MTVLRTARRQSVVVVTLAVVLASGCAREAVVTGSPEHPTSADAAYLLDHLRARQEAIQTSYSDDVLAERLPNVAFSVDQAEAHSLGAGIVVGEVVRVEAGRGYEADEDDRGGRPVSFDSPDALWRTMSVTVSVSQAWGYNGERASFGLAFDAQADRLRMLHGARELGQVIVALGPQGLYGNDPSLYSVARNASVIGQVSSDGSFTLPALGESEATYLADTRTLASIEKAARRPGRTIEIVGDTRSR